MNYIKLKNKILFMLFVLTTFIFTVILFFQYKIEQNTISDMVYTEKTKLQNIYRYSLDNFYFLYRTLGLKLLSNEEVTLAVKNNDRKKLLELTQDFYDNLKKDNQYFHNMHFHTVNTTSILRVHKHGKYGDNLKQSRPMIVAVNKEKKILHGIEVGKHAISFRVAFPVFHKKEHVGSMELGIKIDYLTNLLKSKFDTDSLFVFHNRILTHLFKYSKNDINHKTINHISLFNYKDCNLPDNISFDKIDKVLHDNKLFKLNNSNLYLSEISKLKDYKNDPVGHIVFAINMNKFMERIHIYRATIVTSIFIFIVALFFMLNRWFNFFVKEVETNQNKLEELTQIDELTKLFNRRKILDLINCEYDRSKRYEISDTIIIFDIDHFKKINDTYGHNTGDSVLKELATLLKQIVRKTDHVGRWGGEEFIIIATQTNINDSKIFTEKIRKTIEQNKFSEVDKVTCSFGIAKLDTDLDYKESINKADKALYKAKETGRNKVIVYNEN